MDCQGNSINALGPIGSTNAQFFEQFYAGTGFFYIPANNKIEDCYLEGFGDVNFNILHYSAFWRISDNMLRDAQVANMWIGDGNDNAENNSIISNTIHNDLSIVPEGSGYGFYISPELPGGSSGSSDNQVVNMFADGCVWSCFSVNSAGASVTTVHAYLSFAGPTYQIIGAKTIMTDVIGDNAPPNTATFYIGGSLEVLNSWEANTSGTTNAQYGVYLANNNNNVVGCGSIGATVMNWSTNLARIVFQSGSGTNNRIANCITGGQDQPLFTNGTQYLNGNLWISTVQPTLGVGFGNAPTIIFNTTRSFRIVSGGTGQAATSTLSAFQTAANYWNCRAQDLSADALTSRMTSSSNAAVTMTWSGTIASGDILYFECDGM